MRLRFYATKKRWNSFIRPDIDETHNINGDFEYTYLKQDDVSMSKPVFLIAANNYPEANYCIISDYNGPDGTGRVYRPDRIYYWIKDISHKSANRWYIECEIDLFATWRSWILDHNAFIERSNSYYNQYIVDSEIPSEVHITNRTAVSSDAFFDNSEMAGTFLLSVLSAGPGGTTMPSIAVTYALTSTNLIGVKNRLMLGANLEMFKQKFADVASALIKLRYSPFSMSDIANMNNQGSVYVGDYNTEVPGRQLRTARLDRFALLDIPKPFNDFRDVTQTSYTLRLPFAGIVPISAAQLAGATQLSVSFIYDTFSGDYCYYIQAFVNGSLMPIATYNGNCDITMPLGAYQTNIDRAAGHALSMGVAGITTVATAAIGSIPMAVGAGAATVAGAANTIQSLNQKTASVIGSYNGNTSQYIGNKVVLSCETTGQSIAPALVASTIGRPCYSVHNLYTCSGYVKTKNFRLRNSGYMTLNEQKYIEDVMNNVGVFV